MFKSELKKSIERLKDIDCLKDVTLREFAPLLGMLAVCTTIAVFWNVSDSLFLKMVGYVAFLSLFWFQLHEKVKDVIVEIYLTTKRSRYGYLQSILKNIAYSFAISAIIMIASFVFDQIVVGLTVISVTILISILSSIKFLQDKKPIYMTSVDIAIKRHELIESFKLEYEFYIYLVRSLSVSDKSAFAISRLGYLDYYLNVIADDEDLMQLDLDEARKDRNQFFYDLEFKIFNHAVDHNEVKILDQLVRKAIKSMIHQKIDIAHYLD